MTTEELRKSAQDHISRKRRESKEALRTRGENMFPFSGGEAIQYLSTWNPEEVSK